MKRRDFLKLTGMGVLSLATPRTLLAMGDTMGGSLDPRDPGGFVNALKRPGHHGGLLGYLDPHGDFTIKAMRAQAPVLPGKTSDLLVYGVTDGCKSYVNPILTVRKGERLLPTLKNELSADTIIHWHGLIVDSKNDGIPTDAIGAGESYRYDFTVANRGGTYWYHPHPYELTSAQAYLGMASFFIVEDEDELRLRHALDLEPGHTDIPLVIQDKRFDAMGNVVYNPSENEWFMGFLGDTILANLTVKPYLDVATRLYRFRLLNGSNARIYRLAFVSPEGVVPFSLIGTDGGLLDRPWTVKELFLAPGERADILLDLSDFRVGDSLFLKSLPFDPMDNEQMAGGMAAEPSMGIANGEEFYVMKLNVKRRAWSYARIPRSLSVVAPINTANAMMRQLTLAQAGPGVMKWAINGETFDPTRISFEVERGSVEVWEIMNEMMGMPHPMHIHGFQFQVLGREGSPQQTAGLAVDGGRLPSDLGWKDTILIWPGETIRVAVDLSIPYAGPQQYVFHCHNLEHEDMGMMVNYMVR
ncbi:multicopper oxidase family protein [Geobacter grbiciae]|uniref:multicopper oxidase family protein n=1 Tax=Geobacter grbiciae TaxID=155042 RepID=UPI001C0268DB|nr:multicopper oxidase family protein [Geobacter grbiciae]MBT1074254.1 multicopper oxidase family protein [Geobacter grbiciae]